MRNLMIFAILATAALTGCWGCGLSEAKHAAPTVLVKGQIRYQGQPLTGGEVVFEPTDIGREAHGRIQPDGTFELTTFQSGDGAVPGVHRVGVTGTLKGSQARLPFKYRNPTSSRTEIEVSEATTEYLVDLK